MNFNYDIKFTDNTPQLHEALDSWAERVLTLWGMTVQDLRPAACAYWHGRQHGH